MKEEMIKKIIEIIKQYNDFENDKGYMYEAAEEILSLFPSLDNLEVVEECKRCKGRGSFKPELRHIEMKCLKCQGEGKVTRAATWEDIDIVGMVKWLNIIGEKTNSGNIPVSSGGILRVKGE